MAFWSSFGESAMSARSSAYWMYRITLFSKDGALWTKISGRSARKRLKRRGLEGSPWGTPTFEMKGEETELNDFILELMLPSMKWRRLHKECGNPSSWSFEKSKDLSTESKAFEKSTKQTNNFFLAVICLWAISCNSAAAADVEWLRRKPNWKVGRRLFNEAKFVILLHKSEEKAFRKGFWMAIER